MTFYKIIYRKLYFLNKRKYLAGLRVEIDQLWSKIDRLVNDARGMVDDGKIFIALENYTDVQPFIPPFYVKKSFYDALSDSPYRINEFITVEGIISLLGGRVLVLKGPTNIIVTSKADVYLINNGTSA
mgnify:CR=1 FL=1